MLKVHGRAACVRVWRGSRERGPSVFFDAYSCGTPKVLWRKVSFRYLILDSHRKSSEKKLGFPCGLNCQRVAANGLNVLFGILLSGCIILES